jgi:hypothetical protein
MFYNGITTIEAKTRLALEQLSGIMIWEIGQDDFGEYSLLNKIWQTVEMTITNLDIEDHLSMKVFPNPFTNYLRIESQGIEIQSVSLYHAMGGVILKDSEPGRLSDLQLPAGIYFLEISTLDKKYSTKVFKQ